ncbi:hypothetical protein [Microbulbifer sp. TRSA005]|uniref:hypothetical protein n=1 Tax=unclassified Microbulbifer TaxID=2619833 RepID=UPI004039DD85
MHCSGCGKDIPFSGEVCPYCNRSKSYDKKYLSLAPFLALVFALFGYGLFDWWGVIIGLIAGYVCPAFIISDNDSNGPHENLSLENSKREQVSLTYEKSRTRNAHKERKLKTSNTGAHKGSRRKLGQRTNKNKTLEEKDINLNYDSDLIHVDHILASEIDRDEEEQIKIFKFQLQVTNITNINLNDLTVDIDFYGNGEFSGPENYPRQETLAPDETHFFSTYMKFPINTEVIDLDISVKKQKEIKDDHSELPLFAWIFMYIGLFYTLFKGFHIIFDLPFN